MEREIVIRMCVAQVLTATIKNMPMSAGATSHDAMCLMCYTMVADILGFDINEKDEELWSDVEDEIDNQIDWDNFEEIAEWTEGLSKMETAFS